MMTRLSRHLSMMAVAGALAGGSPSVFARTGTYEFPVAREATKLADDQIAVQQLSRGVATIGKKASSAIVFVSVSKSVQGDQVPPGLRDPFEEFFGIPRPGGRGRAEPRRQAPKQEGVGSGFFFDLDRGYILTNNHVIEGADEIHLKLANGDTPEGKVIGRDPTTDIAVIEVKSFNRAGLSALDFADSSKVEVGDIAVAAGAPFGLEASISFGIVSAIGRGSLGITEVGDFIQTDAAINPGNSGGPLLNAAAQAIGMNTAIFSRSGAYNGIGFAVPSNIARLVATRLINNGSVSRGYIGAALQPVSPELVDSLKLPHDAVVNGALVANVADGGPAEKAGLEPGDVVTAVDGTALKNVSDLVNQIGLKEPGTKVDLTYYRNGKKGDLTVRLDKWPKSRTKDEEQPALGSREEKTGPLGLAVAPFSRDLANEYRLESRDGGVVVVNIAADSPAERAGLEPGDLILSVNRHDVTSPEQFKKLTQEGGAKLLLRIERSGRFFFATLNKGRGAS
jgi:serine protease Do